ncbi:putative ABC transport system ATP-binding protein [Breznakia blatticola]|uniref:Putative ABC transport system ATP-binding protein n=1 Tax=Breznakia blatticola TaxID=1754012 RepID=A0A4R7ZEJ1_9FIRM|nr:ATP-binding cassette domain-containing protein [Breznakia blatticola]TDW14661.1 putative ABC transport system ATP-binding protein [Breznakia blatticola]
MMVVECKDISKSFGENQVLKGFSYKFEKGKIYVLYGVSGSGKSTLLNLIGGIDKPSSGEVIYYKNDVVDTSSKTILFRKRIAYLFQNYALVDNKSVKYNLEIALSYDNSKNKTEKMNLVLERVGLSDYLDKMIYTLSGGEQQRVALARALLKESDIILADEPTGNLDDKNAEVVISIFKQLRDEGKTIIIATHDVEFSQFSDEKIVLKSKNSNRTK